jgi:uncharacterized membrane protein
MREEKDSQPTLSSPGGWAHGFDLGLGGFLFGALVYASAVAVAILVGRVFLTGNYRFVWLGWNLILAWIPFILVVFCWRVHGPAHRLWRWGAGLLWVLFFPNAFYIITDLVHLREKVKDGVPAWYDVLMIASFACTGLFLGCVSLYGMHLSVQRSRGPRAGWLFALAMLGASAFGIYLGRFVRLNSWDAIFRPLNLVDQVSALFEPPTVRPVVLFSAIFFFRSARTTQRW